MWLSNNLFLFYARLVHDFLVENSENVRVHFTEFQEVPFRLPDPNASGLKSSPGSWLWVTPLQWLLHSPGVKVHEGSMCAWMDRGTLHPATDMHMHYKNASLALVLLNALRAIYTSRGGLRPFRLSRTVLAPLGSSRSTKDGPRGQRLWIFSRHFAGAKCRRSAAKTTPEMGVSHKSVTGQGRKKHNCQILISSVWHHVIRFVDLSMMGLWIWPWIFHASAAERPLSYKRKTVTKKLQSLQVLLPPARFTDC